MKWSRVLGPGTVTGHIFHGNQIKKGSFNPDPRGWAENILCLSPFVFEFVSCVYIFVYDHFKEIKIHYLCGYVNV